MYLVLSSVDIGMIVRTILKPCISLCQLFLSLCSWTNIICIKASTNSTIFIDFLSDPTTCNLWENQWTVRLPKHLIPFWNSKKYNQPPLPNIYYDTSLKINQTFCSQKQTFGNKNNASSTFQAWAGEFVCVLVYFHFLRPLFSINLTFI